jgi:hypothetical protein
LYICNDSILARYRNMTTLNIRAKSTILMGALVMSQTFGLAPLPVLADSSVRMAGQTLFSLGTGGDSRAQTVQNNLDNALVAAKDKTPSSVNITYVKGLPVITMAGYQVVTVDGASAKAAGSTPAVLAQKWANSIRDSLRDQTSVESYVAQLTGSYASSAPSVTASAPAITASAPVEAQAPQAPPQGQPMQTPISYQGQVGYQNLPPQGAPGYGAPPMYNNQGGAPYYQQGGAGYQPQFQGRVAMAPAGLSMPISLKTSISTQVAKAGDMIEAQISQTMYLGNGTIPAGSVVEGTITEAKDGKRLSRSGELSIKFNRLRTPDGIETPITAHLVGGIGKYTDEGSDTSDTVKGEGWKAKVGQTAIRGGVGAGAGAALGTALGAIAGGGRGVGRGAWGGAAIGGGVGAASMLMRKGRDVIIPSGTQMNLQLDAPATIAGGGGPGQIAQPPYGGNL